MSSSPFQINAARRRSMGVPVTPASRLSISSPAPSPSLSATRPFDWDAARNMKPPPYATPIQKSKGRKSVAIGGPTDNFDTPRRPRIIRRQSWFERLKYLPSAIAFEISLFPHNVPLPPLLLTGRVVGGLLHVFHFLVRYRALQTYKDEDLGWEDMKHEMDGFPSLDMDDESSGISWTTPLATLLLTFSILNTLYLFTRFKQYQLLLRTGNSDLPSTPHASYVPSTLVDQPSRSNLSFAWQFFWGVVAALGHIWRFILNTAPALPKSTPAKPQGPQTQQIDVWAPGEGELAVFSIYSPVHALLWFVVNPSNWVISIVVMCITTAQIHGVIQAYETLIKDKAIISAEVMHEYNTKFVHPRLMPVRKDACVMTSEAEMVGEAIWR